MSDINKGAVGLILVLLLGAGGYLWFTMLYKPAVAERDTASQAAQAAESELQAAKSELAAAQEQLEQSKDEAAKPDDSVSRVQLANKAIPQKELVDDAAIVLMDLADQAGISTSFSAGSSEGGLDAAAVDTGALQGATPIDLTFEAGGTYQEMMLFMDLVEGTVRAKDGKLYATDRLFNVVKLEIGGDGDSSGSGNDSGAMLDGSSGSSGEESGPILGPNDMLFTVTVRMYTSSQANAEAVGAATPDLAAAPTDDAAANGASGSADANATDPNASGDAGAQQPATAGATNTGGEQ